MDPCSQLLHLRELRLNRIRSRTSSKGGASCIVERPMERVRILVAGSEGTHVFHDSAGTPHPVARLLNFQGSHRASWDRTTDEVKGTELAWRYANFFNGKQLWSLDGGKFQPVLATLPALPTLETLR